MDGEFICGCLFRGLGGNETFGRIDKIVLNACLTDTEALGILRWFFQVLVLRVSVLSSLGFFSQGNPNFAYVA